LLTVAVNDCVPFTGTLALVGATATAIAGTVTVAGFDLVVSATEVAVIVTVRLLAGGADGAVYVVARPLEVLVGETDPHGAAEHATAQVTPLFPGSLASVAVNEAVLPNNTVAVPGATETVTAKTLIVAVPDFVESEADVAVIVTVRSLAGGVDGAV
jgi:hypothetical protein